MWRKKGNNESNMELFPFSIKTLQSNIMKLKLFITAILILLCGTTAEAQLLEKLKKRAEEKGLETREVSYDSTDNAKNRSTSFEKEELTLNSAKDFFNNDVVLKLIDDKKEVVQTMFFDKEVIAMRTEQNDKSKPIYHDSKGKFYVFNKDEGYYEKASLLPPSLSGFMFAGMIPQFYNLPPEPYLEAFQALEDIGSGLNFMILELTFIYKPIHFKDNENYTPESVNCNETNDCIRFNYNDPEYPESYIQFDDKGRLVILKIKTTKTFGAESQDSNTQEPTSGKYVYSYQECSVKLPDAIEQSMIPGPLGKFFDLEKGLEPWKHNKKDKQKKNNN